MVYYILIVAPYRQTWADTLLLKNEAIMKQQKLPFHIAIK